MSLRITNMQPRIETAVVQLPPLRVDDYIPDVDLSVRRALEHIPIEDRESYANLYRWFISETGKVGSRHLGERLPGVAFKHAAQRGIHTPTRRKYAATIMVSYRSLYANSGDGKRIELGDGTWVLHYSAHRNNTGGETDPQWNEHLLDCMRDGVPVGVFLQQSSSSRSYLRALAFVEEFDPAKDLFTLHGPVTPETEHLFRSTLSGQGAEIAGRDAEVSQSELEQDRRDFATVRRAIREGQGRFRKELVEAYGGRCAVTETSTKEVLQAAHILDYRGTQSNVISNGILLRSDIHLLFDDYLIGIDPSSLRIAVSSRIPDGVYTELDGKSIKLPSERRLWPNEQFLDAKFKRFKCEEA